VLFFLKAAKASAQDLFVVDVHFQDFLVRFHSSIFGILQLVQRKHSWVAV
jgi:hypothetical protein